LAGPFAADYIARLDDGAELGIKLSFVQEPAPAGTAGALTYARTRLRPEFLLLNGDSYFDINLLDLVARARNTDALITLALAAVADADRYGSVVLAGNRIARFSEKAGNGPGLINGGVYWIRREILDQIGGPPISLECDVLPKLVAHDRAAGIAYSARFIDIGTPSDLERARKLLPQWRRRPAAFLDRDGVLNRDAGYVWRPQDFEWLSGARQAIKILNDAGFFVVIATNQAGVARGLYREIDVASLHRWINEDLAVDGAHIDAFYYCPHHPTEGVGAYRRICDCRKPAPGMLLQAMRDWPIDRAASFMIGDKDIDLEAAHAAGIRGIRSAAPLDILVRDLMMDRN